MQCRAREAGKKPKQEFAEKHEENQKGTGVSQIPSGKNREEELSTASTAMERGA